MAAIAGAGSRGGGAFRQSRRKILGDGNGCERCGLSAFHAAAARPAEKTMGSAIRGKKARVVAGKVEQGLEAIVPETGFEDDRRMAEEEAAPGPNNRGARRGVDTTIRKSNDDDLTKPWAGRGDAGGTSGRSIGQSSRGSSGRSSGSGSGSGSALCSSSSAQDTPVMLTRAASSPSLTTCSFPNSSPSPLPFMSASPPRSPSPFPSPRCPSPCAHSARTRTSPEGFSPPSPPSSPGAQPSCLGACRLLPRARGPTKSAGRPPSGWRAGGAVTEALPRWHAGAAGLDLRGEGSGVEGLVDGWRLDEIQRVAGGCFFAERRTLAEGGIGAEERGRGGDGRSLRDSRRGEWFAGRLVGESVRFMGDHVRSLGDSWAGGRRAHGLRRGGKGMVREGCVADENAWEESGEEMDGARQLEEGWGEDEDAGESEEEEGEEKEEEEKEEEEEEEEEWWMHHPRPQTPMMLLEWQDLVVGEMGDEEKEAAGFWRSGGGVLGGGAGSGSRSGRRRRESGSEWGDGTESWREGSMECDLVEEERGDLQREQSDAAVREAAGTGSHDGKSWLGPPM
ncbi:unnamed protein product [Closterium sp. NIES-65]|nr:unnamed protein product [Closterium sp. NIES-65]